MGFGSHLAGGAKAQRGDGARGDRRARARGRARSRSRRRRGGSGRASRYQLNTVTPPHAAPLRTYTSGWVLQAKSMKRAGAPRRRSSIGERETNTKWCEVTHTAKLCRLPSFFCSSPLFCTRPGRRGQGGSHQAVQGGQALSHPQGRPRLAVSNLHPLRRTLVHCLSPPLTRRTERPDTGV